MKDKLRPALSAIAVAIAGYASYPLITLIFSNGLLWNYTQSQLQCEQLDVEKAVKINGLRRRQTNISLEILENTKRYLDALDSHEKVGTSAFYNDIIRIKA
jgi:hypothetical protein